MTLKQITAEKSASWRLRGTMATLQEAEADIKAIAAKINDMKASGTAKTDPALEQHVVRKGNLHSIIVFEYLT